MSAYFAPPPAPPTAPGFAPPLVYPQYQVPMGFAPTPALPKGPRPGTLNTAFGLMLAGIGLSLLAMITTFASMQTIDDRIREQIGFYDDSASRHAGVLILTVLFGIVGNGLWIWMSIACRAGYNWARITGTVFFGVGCLLWLLVIGNDAFTPPIKIFAGLAGLVGLASMILLWVGPSGRYFRPGLPAGYPGYAAGYPGYPGQVPGAQYGQHPGYAQGPYPGAGQPGYGYQQPDQPPANWPGQGG